MASHPDGAGDDDLMRAEKALLGVVGKRLTYRTTGGQLEA